MKKDNNFSTAPKTPPNRRSDGEELEAVALEYNMSLQAPVVLAAGKGYVAKNIIKEAKKLNIPIHRDEETARMLNMLKIGEEIPPELYFVVAQILIYVGDMDKTKGEALVKASPKNTNQ